MITEETEAGRDRQPTKPQHGLFDQHKFAADRMPGVGRLFDRFVAEIPAQLASLIPGPISGAIAGIQSTALPQAIADCTGLAAGVFVMAQSDAQVVIAVGENVEDRIVASIFGRLAVDESPEPASREYHKPPTAIEAALLEAFVVALGTAFEAAFAPVAPLAMTLQRIATVRDANFLDARDSEAVAARFSVTMAEGACECLILAPHSLLLPFRRKLMRDPATDAPSADKNWSQLMEAGVQMTRLPVMAVIEEIPMQLDDVANLRVGGVLTLQRSDLRGVRLDCSGRRMFSCKLGQFEGRYHLEIEQPLG